MALALSASLVPSTFLGRPARPARQAAASRPLAWLLGGRRRSLLRVQAELKVPGRAAEQLHVVWRRSAGLLLTLCSH